jgi:hypothetical protein
MLQCPSQQKPTGCLPFAANPSATSRRASWLDKRSSSPKERVWLPSIIAVASACWLACSPRLSSMDIALLAAGLEGST